jgi:hypothetical protein
MNKHNPIYSAAAKTATLVAAISVLSIVPGAQAQVAAEYGLLGAQSVPSNSSKIIPPKPLKTVAAKPAATKSATAATAAANDAKLVVPSCASELTPADFLSVPEGKSSLLNMQKLNFASGAFLRTVGDPEIVFCIWQKSRLHQFNISRCCRPVRLG